MEILIKFPGLPLPVNSGWMKLFTRSAYRSTRKLINRSKIDIAHCALRGIRSAGIYRPIKKKCGVWIEYLLAPRQRTRDVDHGAKVILDAMSGVIYDDDRRVIWLLQTKRNAKKSSTNITIYTGSALCNLKNIHT